MKCLIRGFEPCWGLFVSCASCGLHVATSAKSWSLVKRNPISSLCVCVCVCVCERERERDLQISTLKWPQPKRKLGCATERKKPIMSVYFEKSEHKFRIVSSPDKIQQLILLFSTIPFGLKCHHSVEHINDYYINTHTHSLYEIEVSKPHQQILIGGYI